jgi:arylsulfatase A-like enzyme
MPETPPNIVVLAVDSLRADHLGCYGYAKDTSPEIDALASDSILFECAFAAGIPTMPAFTTFYTGLHPYRHGIVAHSGNRRLSDRIILLPQLLKERGYITAACDNLVAQSEGRGSWFARGYDQYSGFIYKPFSDQSAQLTDRAIGFLREHTASDGEAPLFLFVHYWDPHSPYGPRPPFDTLHYQPGSGPADMADVRRINPDYYDAFLGDMRLRHPDDYAYVVAQYDGEISQVDVQIGRVVRELKARGMWENTVLLVMADHGECFGEGDLHFDHHGLYDAVTRIALMMRVPGLDARRCRALISSEDLLPTLLELAGAPTTPYPLTGASLRPLLEQQADAVRPYVVTSESSRQASLALRTGEWKLILPIVADAAGNPLPDLYGRPRNPDPLLFDLAGDPCERHDLHEHRPDTLEELSRILADWRSEMSAASGEPDPIQAQGLSLRYDVFMERLFGRRPPSA